MDSFDAFLLDPRDFGWRAREGDARPSPPPAHRDEEPLGSLPNLPALPRPRGLTGLQNPTGLRALTSGLEFTSLLACAGLLAACTLPSGGTSDPPRIQTFAATPGGSVPVEGPVTLEARYSGGKGFLDPGGLPLASGASLVIEPASTATYTLRVRDGGGREASAALTVQVRPGLAVHVTGLPEGAAGAVRILGPAGFRRDLTSTTRLPDLVPGPYRVETLEVRDRGVLRPPWEPVQLVEVADTGVRVEARYPPTALRVALPLGPDIDFVLVPAGRFSMGGTEPSPPPTPLPVHPVTFARAFYMASCLTTQSQWRAVTGGNPSRRQDDGRFPVDGVSFLDIRDAFLPALNALLPGYGFRLPSESEWEYACRAGTTTAYFFGEDPDSYGTYAWIHGPDLQDCHPVGMKVPNPWGLHDLHGCVYQWCEDLAHAGYTGAPGEGSPWLTPDATSWNGRIVRGAPLHAVRSDAMSGSRGAMSPGDRRGNAGFRLVLTSPGHPW